MHRGLFALLAMALLLPQAVSYAQPAAKAAGQAYPARPIRFIISFGPGSASDVLARITGQELSQSLGQPIIVIPKPGADGAISAVEVMRATADGHTFLYGTNSAYAVVPNIRREPPYNVLTDFTPVTFIGENTFFIVVHPSVPAKTLNELIAHAKAKPDVLYFAAGNTYALVSTHLFSAINGIKMVSVPYRSEPEAMTDLLSGRVSVMNSTATSVLTHVREGRLRALATTLHVRSPLMPDVPSFPEAGQQKFPIGPWFGLVGPAGLPSAIVARMNKEMVAVLDKPSVKEAKLKHGFVARSSTPQALAAYMKDQLEVWKSALKAAGIPQQ
ncbi:MAG: tripartite tricarboxylate transporter substrate binding protein [Betaproteobacteria bacterium]|nr:tripartite tricarboxylate transporter substrate binding protein [Betaproteobacteria bacterium]